MLLEDYIKMWKERYFDGGNDVADNLTEAKELNTMFYKNICKKHGQMLFYTKDNSCPACAKIKREARKKTNRVFNRSRELFNETKVRAVKRGVPHTITKEDVRNMFGIVKTCPIFGVELDYTGGVRTDNSPSLDRVIPELGYVKGNVAVISERANRLKNDGTPLENLQVAVWQLRHDNYTDKEIKELIC